jgi:hypothetical protein
MRGSIRAVLVLGILVWAGCEPEEPTQVAMNTDTGTCEDRLMTYANTLTDRVWAIEDPDERYKEYLRSIGLIAQYAREIGCEGF